MAAAAIAKPVETISIDRFIVILPSTLKGAPLALSNKRAPAVFQQKNKALAQLIRPLSRKM
jgi:hypothetical protein